MSRPDVDLVPQRRQRQSTHSDNFIQQEMDNLKQFKRLSIGQMSSPLDPDLPYALPPQPKKAQVKSEDNTLWVPASVHPEVSPNEWQSFVDARVQDLQDKDEPSNKAGSRLSQIISSESDFQDGSEVLERRRRSSEVKQRRRQSILELSAQFTKLSEGPPPEPPKEDLPLVPSGASLRRSGASHRRGRPDISKRHIARATSSGSQSERRDDVRRSLSTGANIQHTKAELQRKLTNPEYRHPEHERGHLEHERIHDVRDSPTPHAAQTAPRTPQIEPAHHNQAATSPVVVQQSPVPRGSPISPSTAQIHSPIPQSQAGALVPQSGSGARTKPLQISIGKNPLTVEEKDDSLEPKEEKSFWRWLPNKEKETTSPTAKTFSNLFKRKKDKEKDKEKDKVADRVSLEKETSKSWAHERELERERIEQKHAEHVQTQPPAPVQPQTVPVQAQQHANTTPAATRAPAQSMGHFHKPANSRSHHQRTEARLANHPREHEGQHHSDHNHHNRQHPRARGESPRPRRESRSPTEPTADRSRPAHRKGRHDKRGSSRSRSRNRRQEPKSPSSSEGEANANIQLPYAIPAHQISDRSYVMMYHRFPLHIERAIYRLSHIKLANPRRPLREQVLLSNFMYAYLNLINQGYQQQMEQQMMQQEYDSDEFYESPDSEDKSYDHYQNYEEEYESYEGAADGYEYGGAQQAQQYGDYDFEFYGHENDSSSSSSSSDVEDLWAGEAR